MITGRPITGRRAIPIGPRVSGQVASWMGIPVLRDPISTEASTTFHVVTDGIEDALD
jgi:hypothetical protein